MSGEDERLAERVSVIETKLDYVATKADLVELRAATKADLVELRAATKADLAELRVATKADLAELQVTLVSAINDLKDNHLKHLEERIAGVSKEIVDRESRLIRWALGLAVAIVAALIVTIGRVL